MFRLLVPALLAVAAPAARAHSGYENQTEIRLEPAGLRIVMRTSHAFARALLGGAVPAGRVSESSAAFPMSAPEAALRVTAGDALLPAGRCDFRFEPQDDVVLQFRYPLPEKWPVTVEALFFEKMEALESGTLAVFDTRASRFVRDAEPLLHRVWDLRRPAVTFAPEAGPPAPPSPAAETNAGPAAPPPRRFWLPAILLAVSVATGLAIERLRRTRGHG